MLREWGVSFMRRYVLIAGSLIAAIMPASADGVASLKDSPVVEEHYGWSGIYFGAGGGFSRVDRSGQTRTDRTKETKSCDKKDFKDKKKCDLPSGFAHESTVTSSTLSSFDDDDWSGFGTVQVGYDRLIHHHLVIGAFADFDLYDGGSSFQFSDGHGSADLDWVWSVGGRFGALVEPRVLLYGVGGYTQAGLDGAVWINNGPTLQNDDHLDGWFAGAGTEVKVRDRISFKLEYRFADYGNSGASGTSFNDSDFECKAKTSHKCVDDDTTKSWSQMDLEVQSIRALVVYRLDHEERVVQPLK